MSSWFVRLDRYGDVHMVRAQDKIIQSGSDVSNSCGIASILMLNFKVKKHLMLAGIEAGAAVSTVPIVGGFVGSQLVRASVDYAVKSEPEVYKIYGSVIGSTYDGSSYTYATKHPPVLKQLGLGEWEGVYIGPNAMYDAIKATVESGYPCIVHCAWNSGGAHFMVVDGVHATSIAVCDPWDGELRIVDAASNTPIKYDPSSTFSFSFGERHEYDSASPGQLSGWIVRKKAA